MSRFNEQTKVIDGVAYTVRRVEHTGRTWVRAAFKRRHSGYVTRTWVDWAVEVDGKHDWTYGKRRSAWKAVDILVRRRAKAALEAAERGV